MPERTPTDRLAAGTRQAKSSAARDPRAAYKVFSANCARSATNSRYMLHNSGCQAPPRTPLMRLSAAIWPATGAGATCSPASASAGGVGRTLAITGRNGAGKSSLLRTIAGLVRLADGELTLGRRRSRTDDRRTGPLSRPPGRAETVTLGGRKPALLGRLSRAQGRRHRGRRSKRSGSTRSPICRRPIFRPASGGGSRSRGSCRQTADLAARRTDQHARCRRHRNASPA